MARVEVNFEEIELKNEQGRMQDGVQATCSRCDHQVEAYGTHERSRRRCLAMLREECPNSEENFYVDSEEC